ncbi:MAG TPA: PadR family transcriptional regulator [Polyangiales bacterium]|jgi:DNA-binding PadR family transcriptional regulator|nr:PadR family transcriptional regulator [Polyangiales bacterium]
MFDHSHFPRHWGAHWEAGRHGPGWGRTPGGGGRRGPGWFDDFFGPPPRAERGGVRYLVLDAISTIARHGYEVIQAIEERSGRAYRPSPGVVYPTLQLLEEMGHAKVAEESGRKVYAITEEGTRDLAEHRDEVTDFYARFEDESWERHAEDFGELMRRAARLFKSFKRAARHGRLSAKGQARIREALDQAVQQIETILHEEAGE